MEELLKTFKECMQNHGHKCITVSSIEDFCEKLHNTGGKYKGFVMTDKLEGLDCGACGAPSCRALAEDVVRGLASTDDCIYNFNSNIQNLIKDMQKLEDYIPRTFRETEKENSSNDTD